MLPALLSQAERANVPALSLRLQDVGHAAHLSGPHCPCLETGFGQLTSQDWGGAGFVGLGLGHAVWRVCCLGQSCDSTPPCSSFQGRPLEALGSPLQHSPPPCLPSPSVVGGNDRENPQEHHRAYDGKGLEKWSPTPGPSPHSGLVHQVLSLAVVLHVRVVGGEHGIKGKDLLLDGAAVRHLQQSTEVAAGSAQPAPPLCSRQHARGLGNTGRIRGQCDPHPDPHPSALGRPLGDMSLPPLEPSQVIPTLLMCKLRL